MSGLAALRKHRATARQDALDKTIKYTDEYLLSEVQEARLKAQAKAENNIWVPAEAKVALVIRIKGINKIAPKSRKILQLFRLRQIFNAVLIKLKSHNEHAPSHRAFRHIRISLQAYDIEAGV